MVSMSQCVFWSVLWSAWIRAFSEENVTSRFRKTGVFAFNPSLVFNKISKKQLTEVFIILKTPLTYRVSRRMYYIYKFKPKDTFVLKLLCVKEHLAAERSINQYIIKRLLKVLK